VGAAGGGEGAAGGGVVGAAAGGEGAAGGEEAGAAVGGGVAVGADESCAGDAVSAGVDGASAGVPGWASSPPASPSPSSPPLVWPPGFAGRLIFGWVDAAPAVAGANPAIATARPAATARRGAARDVGIAPSSRSERQIGQSARNGSAPWSTLRR
jgi:hypothetical protein